ncbi:MAG TPA: hypothetical protein GXZ74_09540 [Tissierellia bacterium]|nr:hypothetical protein [Tissierellia bacterium]
MSEILLYAAVALIAYITIVYMTVKDKKAIFIGITEMAALGIILVILKFSADLVYPTEGINQTIGLGALLTGVVMKLWISPVYRLSDGFVFKDRPYRRSDYPGMEARGYDIYLYTQKSRGKKHLAHHLRLRGPLKDRNKRVITGIYR